MPTVLFCPATVTRSYSSEGYWPGSWAVEPSANNFTKPTGAWGIENWPCASVCTAATDWIALTFACKMLVSTARIVTPGIGTLLLSTTTPDIVVFAGSPDARPDAVKAAGKPWFDGKLASTRLLALPSCRPSVNVAAARPSESVLAVKLGRPSKLPPPW